jgi:hypothetical protein
VISEATQVICVASDNFWWVTPLIVFLSALSAGVISITSILSSKSVAKKRATLDMIERSESTEYYQSLYVAFSQVRKDPAGLMQLVDITNPHLLEQRQKILNFLNHYELIAIGIKMDILDESVYETFMRSTVVRDWDVAADFIAHIRNPSPDSGSEVSASLAFSEFEALARKWSPKVARNLPIAKARPDKTAGSENPS